MGHRSRRRPGVPQVPGKRPAKVRLVNAYMPRRHAAAAHDQALAASLVRVIGLKDRPEGLLRPDRILRVLRGNLASSRRPTSGGNGPSEVNQLMWSNRATVGQELARVVEEDDAVA